MVNSWVRSDYMLKFDFTKQEFEELKSKIYLSPIQERIVEYRLKELSITQMAMIEICSESKISKEIYKIRQKMKKII